MRRDGTWRAWAAGLTVLALTVWAYAPLRAHDFINLDDPGYVYENPHLRSGLGVRSAAWAFTTFQNANWHPLTWLSHALDVELWGLAPGAHHMVSLVLHCLSAALLFAFLFLATGSRWRSLLVTALFALHPTHVESVAWIAERKDVLSGLFWHLALLAYVGYARRPAWSRYVWVAASFVLGLLAKPMVVTLPAILLVLDLWPLGRARLVAADRAKWGRLILEKAPLFALSLASAVVTVVAQAKGGAVSSLRTLTLGERAANAASAFLAYLEKLVWPADLAVFYPHPVFSGAGLPASRVGLAVLVLVLISGVALSARTRWPVLAAGWAWFGVTLLPVIGLVQVGSQAMADRYLYLPATGVFLAVVWGLASVAARRTRSVVAGAAVAIAVLGALSVQTRRQVAFWRDSVTLFEHTLRVTQGNAMAWQNLGTARLARGELAAAVAAFEQAVRAAPEESVHWMNLAASLETAGRPAEAAQGYARARALAPDALEAIYGEARARIASADYGGAAGAFEAATRVTPADPKAWQALGLAYAHAGRAEAVARVIERLRRLDPRAALALEERASAVLAGR